MRIPEKCESVIRAARKWGGLIVILSLPVQAATTVEKLFVQTKPQCIGRYVIDVPESFNNSLMNMIFIDDFRIESRSSYRPPFDQRLARREQELRQAINKPGNAPENAPFIKEIIRLPDNIGVIFDHNESVTVDIYRQLEAHVYINSVEFIITTDIRDFSDSKHKEKKNKFLSRGFTEAESNNKPQKIAMMKSLIFRLSGRHDEDIPQGKGLCIPNGFIRDDTATHHEKITFSYNNEDYIFGIYMNSGFTGTPNTLLNRSNEINEAMKITSHSTIKKGKLAPGGIPSQEWLFLRRHTQDKFSLKELVPVYDFIFYANEEKAAPGRPWLKMGINNEGKQTQYTESQMVDIWDRLVGSLRYRPGAF